MRFRIFISHCLLVATVGVCGNAKVLAQNDCESCSLDERARIATVRGRLLDADRLLSRSLAVRPRASTAYNLALVKQSRGELLAARGLFQALLAGEYEPLPENRRILVRARLTEVTAELPALVVSFTGNTQATVRIDGRASGGVFPGERLTLRLDPGAHSVHVSTPDGGLREMSIRLSARERRTVSVSIEGPSDSSPSSDTASNRRRPRRIALLVAAGVLLAGATATLVLTLRRDEFPAPPDSFVGSVGALASF